MADACDLWIFSLKPKQSGPSEAYNKEAEGAKYSTTKELKYEFGII